MVAKGSFTLLETSRRCSRYPPPVKLITSITEILLKVTFMRTITMLYLETCLNRTPFKCTF